MNKPVNFELAKLLKEKGFDEPCYEYYRITGYGSFRLQDAINHNDDASQETLGGMRYISAPTIAEVVMWLYEKYDVWITVERHEPKALFNYVIVYNDKISVREARGNGFNKPTPAYESAIEYTLKNLIK